MKKIIYDISLLGEGYSNNSNRTGLYRFTEEVLKQLITEKQIDIYLIASKLNHEKCYLYLKDMHPKLQQKLLNVYSTFFLIKMMNKIGKCFNSDQLKHSKFVEKILVILEELSRYTNYFLSILKINHISIDGINDFDIYVSPYHVIPIQVVNKKDIKKIIYVHDLIPLLFSSKIFSRLSHKTLINHLNSKMIIICNSKTTKDDLLKYRPDLNTDKVSVSHLGASQEFQPVKNSQIVNEVKIKYKIPNDVEYVLTLSSLNPRKNFVHVIKSFIAFIKMYKVIDLYLVIGGPRGWEFEDIFNTIDDFKQLKEHIIVIEFVDDVDLPALYNGAFCFTLLSLYEGFGLPVLEAMKCGTPVITSNTSSLLEIAEEGCITINPTSEKEFINALYNIYFSTTKRREYIEAGFLQAAKFSWEKLANELINHVLDDQPLTNE